MPKLIDLTGKTFSRWTVIEKSASRNGSVYWKCECECGTVKDVKAYSLSSGESTSCGCFQRELTSTLAKRVLTKHGMTKTRLHEIWSGMRQRCANQSLTCYKYYGGRGIRVCAEWDESFINFRDWCLRNGYQNGLQIDRIDNDGNYEPSNCRFVTMSENCRNRSTNRIIEYKGRSMCTADWADELGLTYACLEQRINKHGWSIERAFTQPQRKRRSV